PMMPRDSSPRVSHLLHERRDSARHERAAACLEAQKVVANRRPAPSPLTSKALDSIVESLQSRCTDDLDLGGARRGRVIDLYKLTPSSPSIKVAGWQLATSDGQTIYIIKVGRNELRDDGLCEVVPVVQL